MTFGNVQYRLDRASGQVYTEKTMAPAVGFASGPSWVHESPFLNVDYMPRSPLGVPTLRHLATKQALRDQRNLTPSHFVNIPWSIARQLWDYLCRSGKRTMYMWKVFSAAYPTEFRKVSKHYEMDIDLPKMPMRDYLGLVGNDACSWVVDLAVRTEYARTPELVEVANIKNIIILEINTPLQTHLVIEDEEIEIATLSDRIIRTWSELAETSGAFEHLRALKLYGQQNLSGIVFQYFNSFPSLQMCFAVQCRGITSQSAVELAKAYGWQVEKGGELWIDESLHSHDGPGSQLSLDGNSKRMIPPSIHRDAPFLEFKIGQRRASQRTDAQRTVFWRQGLDETGDMSKRIKKRRDPNLTTDEGGAALRKRSKKPIMKNTRNKDLSGLLAEFH